MAQAIIKFRPDEFDRDGLVSVRQVADKMGLSLPTVYKEINSGRMIAYRLTGKYVLRPRDVERWALIYAEKVIGVSTNARMQTRKQMALTA